MECNISGSRRNFMAINAYIKKEKVGQDSSLRKKHTASSQSNLITGYTGWKERTDSLLSSDLQSMREHVYIYTQISKCQKYHTNLKFIIY